jgi:uncharacterized phage protein gp47/JayE
MATKTQADVFAEYRAYLLGLDPTRNPDQTDSDDWIRGQVTAGVVSGLYADQEKVGQDAFPQNARREALLRHKFAYFNVSTFDPATVADGPVIVTGTPSAGPFSAGLTLTHDQTGNTYQTTEDVTLDGSGNGSVTIQSVLAGQDQNLAAGSILSIGAAPAGLDNTATVDVGGISDGTNEENEERLAQRILNRMQSSARGGNDADHREWARAASPAVTDVAVLRYPNGLGTVGVIISSGTTDIDAAVDNDEAIDFTPSDDLIDLVQAYIELVDPVTECVFVSGPVEVEIDVTVVARFTSGDVSTVLSGQTLTQGELVEREVKRAIYKMGTGGTKMPDNTYVALKKSIEDGIDSHLSAGDTVLGSTLQIVLDRLVGNLDGVNENLELTANERPIPGTIVVEDPA